MAKGKYYIKLYHQRLLTSTIGWKDEEFGAYLKLLIYQFDKGSIPADLASICRIAPSAKKHWPLLSQKFITVPGGLINEVMNDVRNKTMAKGKKSAENGKTGGRPIAVKPGESRVYLIECFDVTERFYKAGVTHQTINARFSSAEGNSSAMPYNFRTILDRICPCETARLVEEEVRNNCKRYSPKMKFGGHLECYEISQSVIDLITQIITKNNLTGYEKETHTHVSLCISDSALKDGGVGEELIVPAMVKQFKEENPKYFIDQTNDFRAVKELAEKINAWQGLEGDFLSNQKEICRRWGELIVWIKADKHFVKYSLSQINKHFQSIIQSVSNGAYSTATEKTGNRKSEGFEQLSGILRKEITSE